MNETLLSQAIAGLAQEAWDRQRVMHLDRTVNYRIAEFGTARIREEWRCQQDHGYGLCGQMLVPAHHVEIVLGLVHEEELAQVPGNTTTVSWIDTRFSPNFNLIQVEMWHLLDVMNAYRQQHGTDGLFYDLEREDS